MSERQLAHVDAHLILRRGDEILLGKRHHTGWRDGYWHVPAGHGEDREPMTATLVREALEETGVEIDPADARFVHLVHHWTGTARAAVFFEVTRWRGEPATMEPDKCTGWQWFPLSALPQPMIEYTTHAIACYLNGEPYSERGWQQ